MFIFFCSFLCFFLSYLRYSQLSRDHLLSSHMQAWADIWKSGIHIRSSNNDTYLPASVNSSMYYILSNLRDDWSYGISPGGIPYNSYKYVVLYVCVSCSIYLVWLCAMWCVDRVVLLSFCDVSCLIFFHDSGHVFWDSETW